MQRRKNYLIKKQFQYNFSFKFILLLLLESALIIGLFLYLSSDTLTTGFSNSILTVEKTQSFFLIPFLLITLIIAIGISLAGMVVFILLSHRIAGPMYRFEQTLKAINEGDLTTSVNLRKKDQLMDVQNELNVFINTLDKRLSHIKSDLKEVQALLAAKHDPKMHQKLNKKIELILGEINHFKVTSDVTDG